jgi:hypothetical protein
MQREFFLENVYNGKSKGKRIENYTLTQKKK